MSGSTLARVEWDGKLSKERGFDEDFILGSNLVQTAETNVGETTYEQDQREDSVLHI